MWERRKNPGIPGNPPRPSNRFALLAELRGDILTPCPARPATTVCTTLDAGNVARAQLAANPLCRMCVERGRLTPATVADHLLPHHGDVNLFWFGELQCLCASCHGRKKRSKDNGYQPDIGVDGWPTIRGIRRTLRGARGLMPSSHPLFVVS